MELFVTGTDTNVGKTVVSAWLMLHLGACYWKPVQTGTMEGMDASLIRTLTDCEPGDILPSVYELPEPLSPHEAARRAGVDISMDKFVPPEVERPLIVEGAGGVMVPLNDHAFMIDLMDALNYSVVLVCRSSLGTINHTLLSLEALKSRDIPVACIVMNGPSLPHNRDALEEYGGVRVLAEIPPLDPLNKQALLAVQPEHDLEQFFMWPA
ncbi:ATP-dependent dethiobiotin synthetase BioD [bacterium MnTg02]|nr:ATP-dependent dethiobiotin synthetase BioD [bacterium MnTg02]